MQFERQRAIPLRLGHLEQIDLRYRARDIEQDIDLTEGRERLIGDLFGGRNFREVEIEDERLGAGCRDSRCGFVKVFPVARHKRDGGKIPGEADRGRASDALAGAGDDSDGFGHLISPTA
jgi:hypothetical protein